MKKRIITTAICLLAHQVSVADIFEWVDSGSPPWPGTPRSRNVSSTLCPDGAGVDAASNAVLAGLDLTKAYMRNVDLVNADCAGANFYNADFVGADLSGTIFSNANFKNAYFWETETSNACFEGASFDNAYFHNTHLKDMDLRSSSFASIRIEDSTWENLDLSGCSFSNVYMGSPGWVVFEDCNFNDAFLSFYKDDEYTAVLNCTFISASLAGVTFHCQDTDFTGANLSNSKLYLYETNIVFLDSVIDKCFFSGGLTTKQLTETHNYKNDSLAGCHFESGDQYYGSIDLGFVDFKQFNLTNCYFSGELNHSDFRYADLNGGTVEGLLHGADFRGCLNFEPSGANIILTAGSIMGLNLTTTNSNFYLRNDPIPISITNDVLMASNSTISLILDGTNWTSKIDCQNVSTAQLDGTLHLAFTNCIPTELEGHTFQLFEWNQNTRTGEFANVTSAPELGVTWDISKLYTDGTVRLSLVDSDGDNISDSWEETYFGGPTNANPTATCSNGVNTIRQAYIAGLNPNDPFDFFKISNVWNVLGWNATSGRVYSVWWSTNLLNGFQPLETNIPWTVESFTDTNSPANSQMFYKIDVELAD